MSETLSILERGAFRVPPSAGAPYSIERRRLVGYGFSEELIVRNHTDAPLELELRIDMAADFADLFGVNDLAARGRLHRLTDNGRLVLGCTGRGYLREIWITPSAPEARVDEDGIVFELRLEPRGEWTTRLDVAVTPGALPLAA